MLSRRFAAKRQVVGGAPHGATRLRKSSGKSLHDLDDLDEEK